MALLFIATVQVNAKSLYSVPSSSHGAAPHLSNISHVHGFSPLNNPTICDQNFGKMQYTVRPDITSLAIKSFGRGASLERLSPTLLAQKALQGGAPQGRSACCTGDERWLAEKKIAAAREIVQSFVSGKHDDFLDEEVALLWETHLWT